MAALEVVQRDVVGDTILFATPARADGLPQASESQGSSCQGEGDAGTERLSVDRATDCQKHARATK